ncbi:Poly(A) polymerase [Rhizophagus irregularis]|uniref:Poly(A) polymerase n=3 Tax=Rhizophagus irregularis TaxID=588596 RepID=A0A2I1GKZ5_9GLOM|nr:Poly-A polymerase [Rhizophagus irregularis DAOM 181602=DAOM 197198]EXX66012.1 Pap1p [Rhizophagus irregularis DAOM 197198w]PKC59686.1 Poly(A) polymerase [Rhizophagus irregularis]PKY47308.1 Poly(A) polymerase [Rhizophagus irregularis]POG63625.1 Poly-A polymerase [Rhizophagus irregularis DAOM 181602=DAOM 197198]CAG8657195.1 5508_t:CDS:10 [Rhizophagus irregularis]|eukprot:XP_025170491.1 Poly-A polymerase [Rhizophagus irregularis DAOM 181602=DAOM 197198]
MSDLPNGPKHLGVTPPIALNYPTQREIEVTDLLVQELTAQGTFESEDESRRREVVLGKLDKLVKEFVYRTSKKRQLPDADAREAGGKIFTFGSYRLGVHGAGADIDTLCVVPRHVAREDFFSDMHDSLNSLNEVTELTSVTDAYVPVIKMKFQDIPIDLVFAKLNVPKVPDDLELRENLLLKNLDETCIRSLNGSRVTDEILRLVPSIPAFRTSLRCIKLWAHRRAIYSNVMGFFGGVAWAMLVARICQLYPNAIAGAIVSRFFRIMYQWNWPQPVLLKPIEDGPLQVRVWNPKIYHGDRYHLMPIITPAYPSMCATHNVTQSTKKIIEEEFKRAAEIADKVMIGTGKWSDLFSKHDFFSRYRHYLQIITSSDSATRQLKWSGMVESRIRHLISKLEGVDNLYLAHPFVKGFDKVHHCATEQEANDVSHGIYNLKPISEKSGTDSSKSGNENGSNTIYTTTFYIGLLVEPRAVGSTTAHRQLNLSWPISEFTKLVKSWDKFDERYMNITVKNVKCTQLPQEVFEEGEQRPTKLKRTKPGGKAKSNTTTTEQPIKKRKTDKVTDKVDTATDQPNKKRKTDKVIDKDDMTTTEQKRKSDKVEINGSNLESN